METMPLLLCDFYKTVHAEQYPKGITRVTSYFTPRGTRIADDHYILFGLQAFCQKYLINYFNENFFSRPEEDIMAEYTRILNNTLGRGVYDAEKVRKLHQLGYLPIQIRALPEGTRVPIRVPMLEITNTHPDFAWVTNALETLMSCSLWHPIISANVGYRYRQIVNKYYDKTVDNADEKKRRALGDFSMRGQESLESAVASSAGWCLSFVNTATVPAIPFLEKYYNCNCQNEEVAFGAISTEHSVMCSNYAVDGDEKSFIIRLLTEIYPNTSFSMVSDSYDYWNLVRSLADEDIKKAVYAHNGTLLIRGDSGDPIDIVTGTMRTKKMYMNEFIIFNWKNDVAEDEVIEILDYHDNTHRYFRNGRFFVPTAEELGTVRILADIFGCGYNRKGYKCLDSHIKAIYGDSITVQRCEEIFRRLEEDGFAADCVALGVGSFSFQCIEEDGQLKPFTRDTGNFCLKATYCEVNGKEIPIFKNPKTDDQHFKKSQKGCCVVYEDTAGALTCKDGYTFKEASENRHNLLKTVFCDGKMVTTYSLKEIRNTLHKKEF